MSKNVLVLFAAAIVTLVAGVFLMRHELIKEYEETYPEDIIIPERKPKKEKSVVIEEKINEKGESFEIKTENNGK